MQETFLAVDIGASSGRHILGWMEDGALRTEEVYRFPNGVQRVDGHLIWDIDSLFHPSQTVYQIRDIINHKDRLAVNFVILRVFEIFLDIPFTDFLKLLPVYFARPNHIFFFNLC